jgi:polyisoprenoid-binding protein YceI
VRARLARLVRAHPIVTGGLLVVVAVAASGGWYVYDQLHVSAVHVDYVVPSAPRLTADAPSERLFRIQPERSSITYAVDEHLAGRTTTAEGSTQGIAGDLVIDEDDPAASRAGEMVIDVEQLHSDRDLRDNRIRHDFLESHRHPLATFEPGSIEGLPGAIVEGEEVDVTIPGDLTVKETTAPVTLEGTATVEGGEVHLEATTVVQLSTFDAGPIELVGLVSTGDDVTLTFDITFVDPTEVHIPTTVPAPDEPEPDVRADAPSFADDVMPVLQTNCASCHMEGGVGSHTWSLATAGDAADAADGLDLVAGSGYMPPWPASEDSVAFAHDRSLTDEDVQTLVEWAEAGGPLDVEADTPIPATGTNVRVEPDIEATMPEPYTGSTEVENDYRCFVVDPGITEPTWAAGYEFLPDQTDVIHHALAFRVRADQRPTLDAADAAEPGAGWQCYSGIGIPGSQGLGGGSDEVSQFMAWAPGQEATRFPDGTGMPLRPGELVVLQVHYHFDHDAPADQSGLAFELAPPDTIPQDVSYRTYLAPAEIPCRAGLEEGPLCDRAAAVDDLETRYGTFASVIPDALNGLCGASPGDAAGMTDGIATARCDHTIAADGEVIGIFGHMHELGRAFRMTLNPGTPEEEVLLDIPEWDFGWQLNYVPEDELVVEQGDTLRIECTWDRAKLPTPEDRYITWSEGTEDEMCYSALTTIPTRP